MKIAFVSSVGGHLAELLALLDELEEHERFFVLQDPSPLVPAAEKTYYVLHAERDWRVAVNFLEFARIFGAERPDLVITAGAGVAIPAAFFARLAGIPVLYIEPISSVTRLSLTGRLMQPFANKFFVQWPELRAQQVRGAVLGRGTAVIVVITGTGRPFGRLVAAGKVLSEQGQAVWIQHGSAELPPELEDPSSFRTPNS